MRFADGSPEIRNFEVPDSAHQTDMGPRSCRYKEYSSGSVGCPFGQIKEACAELQSRQEFIRNPSVAGLLQLNRSHRNDGRLF